MMTNPLVTVITPTYNCGRFIAETVESILSQSYRNIEYLVLDDGSADNTQQVLSGFRDARLTLLLHPNMGEQATLNKGLRMMRGDYFMFVNADDPLLPGCIETLLRFMECCPHLLCAYPDWQVMDEDRHVRHQVTTRYYDYCWMVRHHTFIPSVGTMFRRSVIGKVGYVDESFRVVADWDYWLRIGAVGTMARVPRTLACWRRRTGQASGGHSDARAAEHIRVIETLFAETLGVPGLHYLKSQAFCWAHLVAASVSGSRWTAITHFAKALRYYPTVLLRLHTYDLLARRLLHVRRKNG